MEIAEEDYIAHYGILRRSGRYPWGSGGNLTETQRNKAFLDFVNELSAQGYKEVDIAKMLDATTTELRAARSIAVNQQRQENIAMAERLHSRGNSNTAIAARMGVSEGTVRNWLAPGAKERADALSGTVNVLKELVAEHKYIDVGAGVENRLKVNGTRLQTAVAVLREEGYNLHYLKIPQVSNPGKFTSAKVLVAPETSWSETYANRAQIHLPNAYSEDGGKTFVGVKTLPPLSVSPKRVAVRYAKDGGAAEDGVMYLRPGVKDLSLGKSSYAQVRILVGKDRYLKGMAFYKDDLPDGIDILFNTNKEDTGDIRDAMKKTTDDVPGNPFGSQIRRQIIERDSKGVEKVTSALNIVYEEGNWNEWSRTISSQVLSKQKPQLAKRQLAIMYDRHKQEYDEIMAITNPVLKKKLLAEFADEADASSVMLKAAALPRQSSHVILPIPSLKDNEVYAPNFTNGEKVVLIRHPHGGIFEIPELKVNNRNPEARKIIGPAAKDAIGINARVAERLSGADFDGDTVLVIPNNKGDIITRPALKELENFNPKERYKKYPGMKVMTAKTKQIQMGDVSNLITDMTIRGAPFPEIARAVRHSMVVIDAEKHELDYRQSALDNGIRQLKEKYQKGPRSGATTLISLATSPERIPERKDRPYTEGGPIDTTTGRRVYVDTGASYRNKKGELVFKTTEVPRLGNVDDAYKLSSGTQIEAIYADHSNKLKALANQARLDYTRTPNAPYDPNAKKTYAKEVASLNAQLTRAKSNAPLERKAQLAAQAEVLARRQANPHMEEEMLRKVRSQALESARQRVGAKKVAIDISDSEWQAIQSGAISSTKLASILDNANPERVKELALPRDSVLLNSAKARRAGILMDAGYTRAEIAKELGVSLSTLDRALYEE